MSAGIFDYKAIKPFESLGLTNKFWTLHIDILIATWVAMLCLLAIALVGRYFIKKELNIVSTGYEAVMSIFIGLCNDSFTHFNYYYFAFIVSIFFFTFFCSFVGVFPYVEEATKDLNTTFAIGLTSFLYIQYQKIRVHGIGGYIKEFFEPFFLLAPVHVVGELSKIASMSFRLFGNILGGGVIYVMVFDLLNKYNKWVLFVMAIILAIAAIAHFFVPAPRARLFHIVVTAFVGILFLVTWLQLFLGIAEGLIQAFVITMLTTTYLAMGTQHIDDAVHEPENKEHA
jgi:F-type H+-transporting ATPase subunit a